MSMLKEPHYNTTQNGSIVLVGPWRSGNSAKHITNLRMVKQILRVFSRSRTFTYDEVTTEAFYSRGGLP